MNITVNFAGDKEIPENLKIMVAGPSGVGKDRFALTAPNPIWANCKAGLTTLALAGPVPFVNIESEQDLLNLKAALDGAPEERAERFGFPIETLVISTVDEFQRTLLLEKLTNDRKDEAGPGDWGWLGQRCNAIFDAISKLPLHVIMLVHVKQETDGERFWIKPQLQGAFVDQIGQYTDVSVLMKANSYLDPEINVETDSITINGITVGNAISFTSSGVENTINEDRYLISRPSESCDWVKDYTNTLPPIFELNFENDFDRILDLRDQIVVNESQSVDIDIDVEVPVLSKPKPKEGYTRKPGKTKPPTANTTTTAKIQELPDHLQLTPKTTTPCSDCTNPIESNDWVELSTSRYDRPLCKSCYTKQKVTT